MIDHGLPAITVIFNKVCVLVTASFVLTLVPGLRRLERSLPVIRDQAAALVVFLLLGLVEEITDRQAGFLNERIVAVCAAGLVAGPWVGLLVSAFVTALAVNCDGLPFATIGVSMLCGGLAGGLLNWWRPGFAQTPLTGFCLTFAISWLRNGLTYLFDPGSYGELHSFREMGVNPVLQGLGTALILVLVAQVRDRDEKAREAASAEVRALQARMNPHFLFNALNALAALATIAPREIPRAVGRLRQFLRASLDQQEQALIPLEEELTVLHAYLDIETLRLGDRLHLQEVLGPGLEGVLIPPFSLQPLAENAVQHGLQSSPKASRLRIEIRRLGQNLEMSVSDDGLGVPAQEIEQIFFTSGPKAHALVLLRRRLRGLFGSSFQLDVSSEVGSGTTVTVRIPLCDRPVAPNDPIEEMTPNGLLTP